MIDVWFVTYGLEILIWYVICEIFLFEVRYQPNMIKGKKYEDVNGNTSMAKRFQTREHYIRRSERSLELEGHIFEWVRYFSLKIPN